MIKCPDCGNPISSNAKQCIHCGCAFQLCPECEAVLAGEHEICPECGFHLKKEDTKQFPEIQNEKSLAHWYDASKISAPFIKTVTTPIFGLILRIGAIILAVIALVGMLMWNNYSNIEEALNAMANYKDTLNSRTLLYILSALIWATASFLGCFRDSIRIWNFGNFVSKNNLQLPTLIDNEFKLGFDQITLSTLEERVEAIRYSLSIIRYEKDISAKIKEQKYDWIRWAGSLLFVASICIFAIINTEAYMQLKLIQDAEFGFKQLRHIWLPIVGIVLFFILDGIGTDGTGDAASTEWMKENLPEHMDDYTHYVDGFNELASKLLEQEEEKKM